MFTPLTGEIRLLDPGAGLGMLSAALVASLLAQDTPPTAITLTTYEIDEAMLPGLNQMLADVADVCSRAGVTFVGELRNEDFLEASAAAMSGDLFAAGVEPYDAVILNPPYRKINVDSKERELCRRIGLETSNIYTAFLAMAAGLLRDGGQMVAIVPRSFANGTYFRPFREWFTASMIFNRMHVYESRNRAFSDDAVLQENVIFHAIKTTDRPAEVIITSSADPSDLDPLYRKVPYDELINPDDPAAVIHIVAGDLRRLRYPSLEQLRRLGERIGETLHDQRQLDRIISEELFAVSGDDQTDPIRVRERIGEATEALRALGLFRERS